MRQLHSRLSKLESGRDTEAYGPFFTTDIPFLDEPTLALTGNGVFRRQSGESAEHFERRVLSAIQPFMTIDDMTDQQLQESIDAIDAVRAARIREMSDEELAQYRATRNDTMTVWATEE